MEYKLLTPGPLSTKRSVREAMQEDSCTWDVEYKNTVQKIRQGLLDVAGLKDDYTTVLMQGSGTFSVESAIISLVGNSDKLLVLSNGAYGKRINEIACKAKKNVIYYSSDETKIYDVSKIEELIKDTKDLTHIAFVHCETTTGILNNIEEVCRLANKYNLKIILDAMSSFGGIEIDVYQNNITALISSANKCLEGVPGFGYVIVKKEEILKSKDNANSLSLDLYDQWNTLEQDEGKWRFTSPTHVVLAFSKALEEFFNEGGVKVRAKRYYENQQLLVNEMSKLGFKECIARENQSSIITTFYYLDNEKFTFEKFYEYLKENGFIIYPGKLSNLKVFRIGNIGQIFKDDIIKLTNIIKNYIEKELEND